MSDQMQNAVRVHRYGGPEVLRLERVPVPKPGEGEVLVRVQAAAVLPTDWRMRQGIFQHIRPHVLPYIPGSAFAGIVESAGKCAVEFKPGDAVFGRSWNGVYAEYTTVPADRLAQKPAGLSFAAAAAIPGGAAAAWTALPAFGGVEAGMKVLVHGAAGGVGMFAVQLARRMGAKVVGTCSASNVDFVRSLGAEQVIDYMSAAFEQELSGVDLVLDTVGGRVQERSLTVLKPGGALVSLVGLPFAELAEEMGVRTRFNSQLADPDIMQDIAELLADGSLQACTSRSFPLAEARQAHELGESGHGRGRIILYPAEGQDRENFVPNRQNMVQ
ncbi:NADPH:quinone reductase [Paenibacillus sp. UNCCL117]|uniref:NADP-dependent oxidoreductase n=1 Tax=unclassified Paenibacillus TaxID=185978 RepID=UPI000886776B|nr:MULTISPECIES: NADP-dependent oxidoreductase [unclassified Paenibacillus]SDE29392.1 NADPH:quinone reductase [Paenibacillus sp. cl123]SFW63281.1 NADPH:quinone reductase [Paenibacillus sp. UNCCL117]